MFVPNMLFIQPQFSVKHAEIIANEINGGVVRIRGDLKVSNGIVNSDIQTKGNIQAKFLNKVKLYGYGDMTITREIMESYIASYYIFTPLYVDSGSFGPFLLPATTY